MFCLFKKPKFMLIIGPQNSGKGTYCRNICAKYNIPHISTGDMLRDHMARGTELGKKAKDLVDNGILVPDEIVFGLIKDRLTKKDAKNGAIFDGFPRSRAQAEQLTNLLDVSAVISCKMPDEISVKRMLKRRTCEKCGKIFTVSDFNNIPDCECGGKLIVRADDNVETLEKRLKTFHEQTEPVIEFFKTYKNKKNKNVFIEVDANKTIDEVNGEINEKLAKLF